MDRHSVRRYARRAWARGGAATQFWFHISKILNLVRGKPARSPEEERKALEKKLANSNVAIVVLIDELDRVEDSEVRAVAQLIKAVGDIRGVSYLVAYDPSRVAEALGTGDSLKDRRESGERYSEKIIQLPIPIRPLFMEDIEALLLAALRGFRVALDQPANESQRTILEYLKSSVRTPREVKRLIGVFAVLEEAVRGEICPYDVLGYSWPLTKAPSVRESIAVNQQQIVDDPDEKELLVRAAGRINGHSGRTALADIFGEHAQPHERLLCALFPRFGSGLEGEGNRVSRRQNLVRLLYMGNPPGMFPRCEIERLWSGNDVASVQLELRRLHKADVLPQFLDRLDDLLPELPEAGDRAFWPALSGLFVRQTDWVSQAESIRSLATDAATSLTRLGFRNRANIPRVERALNALINSSDLILVPWILRKHMYIYGLVQNAPSRGGESVLTCQQTSDLLGRETPRYRDAVESGFALRRLTNVEAIYVLCNAGLWDSSLRANFTRQLNNPSAIATFASLVVPPGYIADRQHLDELFDADTVRDCVNQIIQANALPENPWVALSVQRLAAILNGIDPHSVSNG